jgi:hypothetical protein
MTPTILTKDILDQLAEGLRIVREGPLAPKPGEHIEVRLESITGLLNVSDITDENEIQLSSVTGLITGKLPLPIQVPVRVEVEWSVVELLPGQKQKDLKEGGDFEIVPASAKPGGTLFKVPELSFLFKPRIVEPTEDQIVPGPITAEIRAKVILSATPVNETDEVKSLPVELRLPVLLPVIPLPTVLALFRHANFLPRDTNLRSRANFVDTPDGFVLLVVPEDSPLKALTNLFDVLNTVAQLGSLVGSLVPAQARLLLGLQKLAAAISAQPHIKFRAVKELSNLNAVVMIQRDLTHNDIEVEDEVSSLILIGPEGTKASLFNRRDFGEGDGHLEVLTGGARLVVIRDLHTAGKPVSETGGSIDIKKDSTKRDGFGQAISSLKLARRSSVALPQVDLPVGQFRKVEDFPVNTSVSVGK